MPRQVMSPIDLRSQAERYGITRDQQTVQAIVGILQTVGAAEQKRRDSQTLDRITRAMSGGATAIEAIAAGQEPEFSTGIPGALQRVGGMFQPSPGGMEKSIQQAIIGQGIQGPRVGAMPWAATQMDPEQREKWLDNYGQGVTIQTGQKLLTEPERLARAKAEQDKALGRTGPGFSPSDKKAAGEEMDARLKAAKETKIGPNYTDENLFREWKTYIATNTFTNDNQRENAWNMWKNKIQNKSKDWFIDNEVEWDPEDPKWREAIGLKSQSQGNQDPQSPEEFESKFRGIKDKKQQDAYYEIGKRLWPDLYK